jgi:amino acid adenylation domain-containing protein
MKITENSTIGAHWQDSVIRHSTSCAVADAVCCYTYEEAEVRIGRMRAFLQKQGIHPGQVIAVDTFHRADFWNAVMAIVTSGCAYLPIPPQYPEERKDFMCSDSKAVYRLDQARIESICADENAPCSHEVSDTPDSPCYVIYTSGTTGQPKGVMIRQKWLTNLCAWNTDVTRLNKDSRVLSLNALCFDASVKNIFSPMMVGAQLLMNIEKPMDIRGLYAYISEKRPTHINATPALLELLTEEAAEDGYAGMKSVTCIMSGGEAFRKKPMSILRSNMPDTLRILNVYGPTECTSVTTCHVLTDEDFFDDTKSVPIGSPIGGKKVITVDKDGNSCSPDEQGELYIGGIGTAEGYLHQPEKTAEKFVMFNNERYYRSGDLCSIDNDGAVHYFGRIDTQIKLNGYRIETEEITAKASSLAGIRSAAVLFETEKLVLFYTADDQTEIIAIRDSLAKSLPVYMLPAEYIKIDELPVTERGKTDLSALKKLYNERFAVKQSDTKSTGENDLASQIIVIWSRLLERQDIKADDNFFDVGGNSLKLYKMGKLLEREFSVPIDPMDLMELSSAKKIAGYISDLKRKE